MRGNMKKTILLSIIIILILSCVAHAKKRKGSKPEWLKNPKAVYSKAMYLTAIGEGDSRSDASPLVRRAQGCQRGWVGRFCRPDHLASLGHAYSTQRRRGEPPEFPA